MCVSKNRCALLIKTHRWFGSVCHRFNVEFLQEEEEEEGAGEDEEQPESAERKEHNADGQTGEQNVQSDTAVELAGEASERDQAKEVKVRAGRGFHLENRETRPPRFLLLVQRGVLCNISSR